jgi:hypothetical protein
MIPRPWAINVDCSGAKQSKLGMLESKPLQQKQSELTADLNLSVSGGVGSGLASSRGCDPVMVLFRGAGFSFLNLPFRPSRFVPIEVPLSSLPLCRLACAGPGSLAAAMVGDGVGLGCLVEGGDG